MPYAQAQKQAHQGTSKSGMCRCMNAMAAGDSAPLLGFLLLLADLRSWATCPC